MTLHFTRRGWTNLSFLTVRKTVETAEWVCLVCRLALRFSVFWTVLWNRGYLPIVGLYKGINLNSGALCATLTQATFLGWYRQCVFPDTVYMSKMDFPTCVCSCVCACAHTCACRCSWVSRLEVNSECCFSGVIHRSLFVWLAGWLVGWFSFRTGLNWLASESRAPSVTLIGYRYVSLYRLFTSVLESGPGPYVGVAGIWLTELSL